MMRTKSSTRLPFQTILKLQTTKLAQVEVVKNMTGSLIIRKSTQICLTITNLKPSQSLKKRSNWDNMKIYNWKVYLALTTSRILTAIFPIKLLNRFNTWRRAITIRCCVCNLNSRSRIDKWEFRMQGINWMKNSGKKLKYLAQTNFALKNHWP